MTEQEIINRYFKKMPLPEGVKVGIGDDAAMLVNDNKLLAVTTDTLVQGVHFADSTLPFDIGYKSLAVTLSDVAAMGAEPKWATLALTLEDVNVSWLAEFSRGFFFAAQNFNVFLIGGNLSKGPLTITVQLIGETTNHHCLTRSGAREGDQIYVSGTIGDAGLALKKASIRMNQDEILFCETRLNRPTPRVELGQKLVKLASAAIDVSDGLLADLARLTSESAVGAVLFVEKIPLSTGVKKYVDACGGWALPLSSGDDYELLFTVSCDQVNKLAYVSDSTDCLITHIGHIRSIAGVECLLHNQNFIMPQKKGYDHFSAEV